MRATPARLVLASASLCLVIASGCGGDPGTPDRGPADTAERPPEVGATYFGEDAVAESIARQYEDEFGLRIDVACPAEQEVVVGDSFSCEGRTEEDDLVRLDVQITSADGDYTWPEG